MLATPPQRSNSMHWCQQDSTSSTSDSSDSSLEPSISSFRAHGEHPKSVHLL